MVVDHTGETVGNREIIGPGELRVTHHLHDGKLRPRREQFWRWRCVCCGAEGESGYGMLIRYKHGCPQPEKPWELSGKVCTAQCQGCGHYRAIGTGGGYACHYILDTGHARPKINLLKEVCPVKDTEYQAERATPVSLMIPPQRGDWKAFY